MTVSHMSSAPTVRSLARKLGLSHTTVSDALRGRGRVDAATAQRVRNAAGEAGYRSNPLASAMMSELRRRATFRGVLAAVDIVEPERPDSQRIFHTELMAGGKARATELGCKLESLVVDHAKITMARLDSILQSRGVHGVLVLPSWNAPNWSELDWSHYAGVYTDYFIERPALHCVCCSYYRSMFAMLVQLAERGYQRPGLYLEPRRDERTQHEFSAAFRTFQETQSDVERVPPLFVQGHRRDDFVAWFRRYNPDVVLSHFTDVIEWMEYCGARLPQTHGFASLNLLYKTRPCAGLDLHPRKLSARAVELLIAQLHRNECGVPEQAMTTIVPARWVEGPTVRKAHKASLPDDRVGLEFASVVGDAHLTAAP